MLEDQKQVKEEAEPEKLVEEAEPEKMVEEVEPEKMVEEEEQQQQQQPTPIPSPAPTPVASTSAIKKAKPTSQKGGAYKQRLSLAAHRASQAHLLSSLHDENEEEEEEAEDGEDNGGVSFKSFLSTAGVRFLDSLTSNRRETMIPALAASSEPLETIEDVIKAACILVPELEIFKAAANELVDYTTEAREATKELEQTLNKQSPKLFHDLLEANETDKPRMQVTKSTRPNQTNTP